MLWPATPRVPNNRAPITPTRLIPELLREQVVIAGLEKMEREPPTQPGRHGLKDTGPRIRQDDPRIRQRFARRIDHRPEYRAVGDALARHPPRAQ